jgi:DGQHR domain-containing protein
MVEVPVIKGQVLGVDVYRGFARLSDLARMSRADIYDQEKNPSGTQRDLKKAHARDAYNYVTSKDFGFWPEVVLCARQPKAIRFTQVKGQRGVGVLSVDVNMAQDAKAIAISRVDGNHRLHYADGMTPGFKAVDKLVSFCMAIGLSLEQEIQLFQDINNNQRRMDTSHLDNIRGRLDPDEILRRQNPDLFIAKRLGEDSKSPLNQRVYQGGVKGTAVLIPLRALRTGIGYLLSQTTKLRALPDLEAQYVVVRNFFNAAKRWEPRAFQEPGKSLMLRGAGLWALCFVGAEVVDRCLGKGKFGAADMLAVLRSGPEWDWSATGPFRGFSGRGGAKRIAENVIAEFQDEDGVSMKELFHHIIREA